ncbi:hypothetical protein Tco_0993637 [Tanacetum coccineum]
MLCVTLDERGRFSDEAEKKLEEALNVAKEASFLLQIKNPTQKGRNEFRRLKRKRKPVFLEHPQERFGKPHYHAADPPDFLNYQGSTPSGLLILFVISFFSVFLPFFRLVGKGCKLVGCGSAVPTLEISNDDLSKVKCWETSDDSSTP